MKQLKYLLFTLLLSVYFLSNIHVVYAIDVNQGIYYHPEYAGKENYFPRGYSSHIFNKYLDSIELCRSFLQLKDNDLYMKKQFVYNLGGIAKEELQKVDFGDECGGSIYLDERNFLGVNFLYSKSKNIVNKVLKAAWEEYGMRQMYYSLDYDTTAYRPMEGDLMQIRVYVHDNAGTDPKYTIGNTKVIVKADGGNITARVGNESIFSTANSKVVLNSSDLELVFANQNDYPDYKFADGISLQQMANYITYRDASTNQTTLESQIGPKKIRSLRTDEYSVSTDRKELQYTHGTQIGSFPYSYTVTFDLVVKKKSTTAICGNGIVEIGETCDDASNNGKAGFCSNTCGSKVSYCGNGVVESGESCDSGSNNGKPGFCTATCSGTLQEACTDIYYKDPARFRSMGYQCVTTDRKASGSCTGEQTIVSDGKSYGPCMLTPDANKVCTTCGCIDLDVSNPYSGDYQNLTYKIVISNQALNALGSVVEVKSRQYNEAPGVIKRTYIQNSRMNGVLKEGTNEGDITLTDDANLVRFQTTKRSPRRASEFKTIPDPDIDRDSIISFLKNPKDNPMVVRNLMPGTRAGTIDQSSDGDEITIEIPAKSRTSASGVDKYGQSYTPLLSTTQFVDYILFLKTPTNGASRSVSLSRPFLVTYNAGDVFTSLAVTGIVNARELLRQEASSSPESASLAGTFNEVSGFLFDAANTVQNFNVSQKYSNVSYADSFATSLTKNVDKVSGSTDIPVFALNSVQINNEGAFTSANFTTRPDGERIYTYDVKGGQVILDGGLQGLQLANRSTIVLKNGDLVIRSNVQYQSTNNNIVPAIAFIVQNGSISIDPKVTRLDGVYYAGQKITAPASWKSYYDAGGSPVQLVVNGSLLGNLDEFIASRPFVASPTKGGAALTVNYDGRMISSPPPGLKEILGGTFEKLRQ